MRLLSHFKEHRHYSLINIMDLLYELCLPFVKCNQRFILFLHKKRKFGICSYCCMFVCKLALLSFKFQISSRMGLIVRRNQVRFYNNQTQCAQIPPRGLPCAAAAYGYRFSAEHIPPPPYALPAQYIYPCPKHICPYP